MSTAPVEKYPVEPEDALRFAMGPSVPMERLELIHFLGYPEVLPTTQAGWVEATVARIVADAKADVWDEAFEWCSDMFAMPAENHNPYRNG